MSVLVVIPTRDGNPHIDAFGSVSQACKVHGDATFTTMECRHSLCVSRNKGVAILLSGCYDHILFVDDDTEIPSDTISKLLECDCNVASGCVPTFIKRLPVLAVAERSLDDDYIWRSSWFDGIEEVAACGGACMMIRRAVFDYLPFPWFTDMEFYEDGRYRRVSGDLGFCKKIQSEALGPIMAHGNVRCRHTKVVNVADFIDSKESSFSPLRSRQLQPA